MKIGFIGVGAMGKPMAKNLIKAKHDVFVFDLVLANVNELEKDGATACADIKELAGKAELIIASLPNAKIVDAVMTGDDGVFAACKKGTIIMDMSSVAPESSKAMAKIAKQSELIYIDAPVSGGVAGATAGTLTIMVGCDKETFEKVSPVLKFLGKNIFHAGDTGAGDAVKIVNNLLLGANMASLAEALVLGAKMGLKTQVMKEIISVSSGRSYALDAKLEKFIMADNFDTGFAVDLQYKDLGLAMEAARDTCSPVPMTAAALEVFETARAKGLNRKDISSVVKVWEDLSGIRIKDC